MAFNKDEDRTQAEIKESDIKIFIEELKNADINFENYKKYYKRIKEANVGIDFTIESNQNKWAIKIRELGEMEDSEAFKKDKEAGVLDITIYTHLMNINLLSQEIMTMKFIQQEMYDVLVDKLYQGLDEANALAIKKEVVKAQKEDNDKRNDTMQEIIKQNNALAMEKVENKINQIDEKVLSFIENLQTKSEIHTEKILDKFERIFNNSNINQRNNVYEEIPEQISKTTSRPIKESNKYRPLESNLEPKEVLDKHENNLKDPYKRTVGRPRKKSSSKDNIEDIQESFEKTKIAKID